MRRLSMSVSCFDNVCKPLFYRKRKDESQVIVKAVWRSVSKEMNGPRIHRKLDEPQPPESHGSLPLSDSSNRSSVLSAAVPGY